MSRPDAKQKLLQGSSNEDDYAVADIRRNESVQDAPKDHFNMIYFVCLLLGNGILVAYNFLLSAPDYYYDVYPDKAERILTLIVPVYTVTQVIGLFLTIAYGHLFSFTSRILVCFLVMGVIFFFPIVTGYLVTDADFAFYAILFVAAVTGLTTAILQATITGFCNYLPTDYIQIAIAGQAISGIIASCLRIAINALPVAEDVNAVIYFGIGAIFDILCGLSFLYAIRTAFVRLHLTEYFLTRAYRGTAIPTDENYQQILERTKTQTLLRKLVNPSLPTPTAKDFQTVNNFNYQAQPVQQQPVHAAEQQPQGSVHAKRIELDSDSDSELSSTEKLELDAGTPVAAAEITKSVGSINSASVAQKSKSSAIVLDEERHGNNAAAALQEKQEPPTFLSVFRKIRLLALALFLVFCITFLPFPALITTIKSQHQRLNDSNILPMPVLLVLEYNVFDYIGRKYLASCTLSFSSRTLWIGCAWRIVLYPIYIAMYQNLIFHDAVAHATTALLGLTNGYFCCLCFMWTPAFVKPNEQQLCGAIMSAALVLGITVGSNIALFINAVVPGMQASQSGH